MWRKVDDHQGARKPKFKCAMNRCRVCGRPRGYMRRFHVLCVSEGANEGQIPGVIKASW